MSTFFSLFFTFFCRYVFLCTFVGHFNFHNSILNAMNETTEYEFERLIDKDKFTGRAETEARLDQEHIERAAVLDRAFFDDSVDIIDYKILNLAAKSEEHTITPMDAYESIHERNHNIHPIVEEDIAHEKFLPRMRKLAEAKYLIEMKEENTPGIFKDFKLNLDFK